MEGDEKPMVEAWQVDASKAPIEWTGDLNDDCMATWSGLMLRAEEMTRRLVVGGLRRAHRSHPR